VTGWRWHWGWGGCLERGRVSLKRAGGSAGRIGVYRRGVEGLVFLGWGRPLVVQVWLPFICVFWCGGVFGFI